MAKPPAKRIGRPPDFIRCANCLLVDQPSCIADEKRPNAKCITFPDAVLALLNKGASINSAIETAGVEWPTIQKWRHRGEDALRLQSSGGEPSPEDLPYLKFVKNLARSLTRLKLTVEMNLGRRADNDELTSSELIKILERLDRTRWGQVVGIEHSGSVEMNVVNRYADTIADLLQGIMRGLRLTPEQHELARTVIPLELARVTQTEDQDVIDA